MSIECRGMRRPRTASGNADHALHWRRNGVFQKSCEVKLEMISVKEERRVWLMKVEKKEINIVQARLAFI